MNMIAAVDRNWGIGKNNGLLVSIPADMKFFREMTMGKVIVMGRKTLESFPGSRPLPGRTNVVLTSRPGAAIQGALTADSLEALKELLSAYPPQEIFVIGGGSIYRQLIPWCNTAYITRIDHVFEADTWFPDLDHDPQWKLAECSEEQTYFDLEYWFTRYERTGGQ